MISIVSIHVDLRRSAVAIVRRSSKRCPPPPAVLAGVGNCSAHRDFRRGSPGMEHGPPAPLPTPRTTTGVEGHEVAAPASRRMKYVEIEGIGLPRGRKTGSGWVAGPGLVVTNQPRLAGLAAT